MPYTVPFIVGAQGSHTLSYRAVDRAGNIETAHDAFINLDLTAPAISSSADGDTTWHKADVDVTLTRGDSGGSGLATVEYRAAGQPGLDGGHRRRLHRSRRLARTVPVTCEYRAADRAGNVSTASCTVKFDTTAPETGDDYAGGATWQTGDVHFSLTADDATSGVAGTSWAVDGGAPQSGTDVTVSGDGEHRVSYYSAPTTPATPRRRTA